MSELSIKRFSTPDERRPFADHGHAEILRFDDDTTVGRVVFEPGWKWSQDVKPLAGTDSCQVAHACYIVSGRMVIRMDDGTELEAGPGDVAIIPPGHDGWVIGDEPCIAVDFEGMGHYAERGASQGRARVQSSTQQPPGVH
ncbi:cupin domain-containing protein [Myxococcus sp. MISCRS1]|jgi:mannose-6-phosphate isomerase-like protein (cupin superfamily)|uniref:cupin domain-containing protein n=1 Tax=Myxococcus TaxID=32 RepID=UPI001CC05715|nr:MULTISPECIES: cupin domain-containing protein [unclassified Myxococcus]MBZ4400103.1 cupin domain-containing protein [Myxococcus sp. AS-1-15]MBZ4412398.1 cupin domain-containing protein [Myxococcus sp. XM-1-1-1]MCY0996159.1 cupin domain-containing protein [Myxococcus sp. MISCRS1]BDT33857.1 cupin domain-containing protein [Myxococcus sp. MH1]